MLSKFLSVISALFGLYWRPNGAVPNSRLVLAEDGDPLASMVPDLAIANYVGGNDAEEFLDIGRLMVDRLRAHGDLGSHEKVLEVGCGIGRIAIPLTQYLKTGSYVGFDIIHHGIEWCQKKVTPRHPNFTFFVADVHNKYYHPEGHYPASEYAFPFPDGSFDFVYLTSVFTHMLPVDLERYVSEIGRVLRPGGRCFCTAYMICAIARSHLESGTSFRKFTQGPGYWTDMPGNPEAALAYPEEYLRNVFARSSLEICRVIAGEWWKNQFNQDIFVATRTSDGVQSEAETSALNQVITLSMNTARGNSISSLRVLGVETLDIADLGRGIQASIYFPAEPSNGAICSGVDGHWLNLQSAGNDEGVAARICMPPVKIDRKITVAAYPQRSPSGGELWESEPEQHFCVKTTYALGPFAGLPFPELVELRYQFRSTRPLKFSHLVCDQRNYPTIVPFIPMAFFKADVLTRLFGLAAQDAEWQEFQPQSDVVYHPKQYHQRAMAWMRPDLSWGVALYGPWTLAESGVDNFTAQTFPDYHVNQLCLVDQSLERISASQDGQYDANTQRTAYLIVGNTATISHIIESIESHHQ